MKRAFVFFFLLFFVPCLGHGQTATAEFELRLHYSDPGGGGNSDPVAFGYDPAATTGIDSMFGETYYPGSPGFGGYFLAFALNNASGDYTEIDILPKPGLDSFILQYPIYVSGYQYPAKISWDRSQIPPAVKGIWITPMFEPNYKLADMTMQDSVVITQNVTDTNYYQNWEPAVITVYYNTTPAFLGVSASQNVGEGLISGLEPYPNPMKSTGALAFYLSEQASVTISGYDALGREVLHITKNESPGANTIDLSGISKECSGAIMLRVDAVNDTRQETGSVLMMKE